MSNFYKIKTLGDANNEKLVIVEDYVRGLEMQDWKVGFGNTATKDWPSDASIYLRKTSGKQLTDLLKTIKNTLFVSKRLRQVIERHCRDIQVELLPFTLYDHRKRVLSQDYVIVNPIGTIDCLDLKASDILWDEDKPDKVLDVNKIVLSAKKLKNAPALFRIKEAPTSYIISFPLAKELHDGDYTNVYWDKLTVK